MIDPGKLNRSITFERETTVLDQHRRTLSTWTKFANRRAELVALATEEAARQYGEDAKRMLVFRIRFMRDLSTADRLIYDGAAYNVRALSELGFREGLEIHAEAIQ